MKYLVELENTKTGAKEAILTNYDYRPGEIIYPISKRNKYPGYNEENRHRVLTRVKWDPNNKRLYEFAVKYGAIAE